MMVAPDVPVPHEREMPMLLRVEKVGTVTLLTMTDTKLDAANHDDFMREAEPALVAGAQVILDLHKVEFVDSTGCNVLLRMVSKLRPLNGQLKVCAARPRVHDTFTLVGLHRTTDLYPTVAAGLAAFGVTDTRV
jgi:stage II sporulation protein AA (anti-sigma F factor antagonist)